MARPRIDIKKDQFEKLCAIQCTKEEISAFFNCSEDTIERWCHREYGESFAVVFSKKRGLGRVSLRRHQFRMAENNPTMAIWLGKQYLGQADRQEVSVAIQDDETIREMESYFSQKISEESSKD